MPRDGRIIEIRYEGDPDPASTRLLSLFDASRWVGDRIATKLRELGLGLGTADHLVVVLRAGSPPGDIVLEPATPSGRRARCTLEPGAIELLSSAERDARLADVTFAALAGICVDDPAAAAILAAGRVALDTHGRRLAGLVMESEGAGCLARVLHFLTPLVQGRLRSVRASPRYIAVLEVVDGPTGERRCTRLFEFDTHDELHARVGSIVWNGDHLTIQPRSGHQQRRGVELALADLVPLGDRGHLAAISLEPPG